MKKMILIALALLLTVTAAVAQAPCDKKMTFYSEKQEMINADGSIHKTKTDATKIEASPSSLTVSINDQTDALKGTVKEVICDWKKPFEEGKAMYKITFQRSDGETTEGTVTFEVQDGKLTAIIEIAAMNGRKVRAIIHKYEEKQ